MKKKVLLAFCDPGGGLAIVSLIDELIKNNDIELKVYAGKLSESFLKDLNYEKIDSDIEKNTAEEIFNTSMPDILVTSTGGGNAEQLLRNVASKKNTGSIVILDFWKDYKRRWLYADYEIKDMKDIICVMDTETKKEMTEEGFAENKIAVTGHPYLDRIFNYNRNIKNTGTENADANIRKLLFLSQPLDIIGLQDYTVHPLTVFLEAVKSTSDHLNQKHSVTIKPHPSEINLEEIIRIKDEYESDSLEIKVASDKGIIELIENCDTVIGYNTIAMFESRSLNKRTISLNIAPVRKSLISAMNKAGIEIIKLNAEEIANSLLKDIRPIESKGIFKNGIRNTVDLIYKELNIN